MSARMSRDAVAADLVVTLPTGLSRSLPLVIRDKLTLAGAVSAELLVRPLQERLDRDGQVGAVPRSRPRFPNLGAHAKGLERARRHRDVPEGLEGVRLLDPAGTGASLASRRRPDIPSRVDDRSSR